MVEPPGLQDAFIVAVALDPGDKPPVRRKEIFSAAAAAVGAFLVAAFIKDAEEADEKWIGARFKKRFQARYRKRFPRQDGQPASPAELAVISEADLGFSGGAEPRASSGQRSSHQRLEVASPHRISGIAGALD
jgi:hypothetical protein